MVALSDNWYSILTSSVIEYQFFTFLALSYFLVFYVVKDMFLLHYSFS